MAPSPGGPTLARCRVCGRAFDPSEQHVRLAGVGGVFDRASCALDEPAASDDSSTSAAKPLRSGGGVVRLLETPGRATS